jgi:hypothetical protein
MPEDFKPGCQRPAIKKPQEEKGTSGKCLYGYGWKGDEGNDG